MILTVDTSVAIKWILEEPGSERAKSYLPKWEGDTLRLEHVFLAPALIALEIHNAVSKRLRRGEATFTHLAEAEFAIRHVGRLDPVDDDLVDQARFMSFVGRHWAANRNGNQRPNPGAVFNIYDCIYIAHAKRHGSALLTADKEQAQMAAVFEVPVEFVSPD